MYAKLIYFLIPKNVYVCMCKCMYANVFVYVFVHLHTYLWAYRKDKYHLSNGSGY